MSGVQEMARVWERVLLVPAEKLSRQQRQIVALLARSETTKSVAKMLNLTTKTIWYHRIRIANALGLREFNEAIVTRWACVKGLVTPYP